MTKAADQTIRALHEFITDWVVCGIASTSPAVPNPDSDPGAPMATLPVAAMRLRR